MQTIEELQEQVDSFTSKTRDFMKENPAIQEMIWNIESLPYDLFDAFYKTLPKSRGEMFQLTASQRMSYIYHPFDACQIIFRSTPVKVTCNYSVETI